MIIEFKSKIIQNGQDNLIEFKSPVRVFDRGKFEVFEFADPQSKIMNMIEISKNEINIFAGSMTINLQLNKKVTIEYVSPQGVIYFISLLKKIDRKEDEINFLYTLSSQNETILGEYDITLKVFSELN